MPKDMRNIKKISTLIVMLLVASVIALGIILPSEASSEQETDYHSFNSRSLPKPSAGKLAFIFPKTVVKTYYNNLRAARKLASQGRFEPPPPPPPPSPALSPGQ